MYSRTKGNIVLTAGVIGSTTLTGTGTDDIQVTGKPAFTASRSYRIQIDSTSETFKWSNDGGSTWEATGISIPGLANKGFYTLINAEGEEEGISIRWSSTSGHVNGDRWDFTTTGSVVQNSATAVGTIYTKGHDIVALYLDYDKGNEDGLNLYYVLPKTDDGSILYLKGSLQDLGNGTLQDIGAIQYQYLATANRAIHFETNGAQYVKMYQVRQGSTSATGLFTVSYELIKHD
jgi:hypothetical protein